MGVQSVTMVAKAALTEVTQGPVRRRGSVMPEDLRRLGPKGSGPAEGMTVGAENRPDGRAGAGREPSRRTRAFQPHLALAWPYPAAARRALNVVRLR